MCSPEHSLFAYTSMNADNSSGENLDTQPSRLRMRYVYHFHSYKIACWVILQAFLSSADFFSKSTFSKSSFRDTIRVSNSFDPDHALRLVRQDLGPNCLQMLSTDDTSRQSYYFQFSILLPIIRMCDRVILLLIRKDRSLCPKRLILLIDLSSF